jgi:hypothetical protein
MRKKGKANPVQAWTDPEGSRRLRFPNFKTVTHEDGKPYAPAAFTSKK